MQAEVPEVDVRLSKLVEEALDFLFPSKEGDLLLQA